MDDWKSLLDLEGALGGGDRVLDGVLGLVKKMVTFRLISDYRRIHSDAVEMEKVAGIMKSNVLLDKRSELDQLLEFLGVRIDIVAAVCNVGCLEMANTELGIELNLTFEVIKVKLDHKLLIDTPDPAEQK